MIEVEFSDQIEEVFNRRLKQIADSPYSWPKIAEWTLTGYLTPDGRKTF